MSSPNNTTQAKPQPMSAYTQEESGFHRTFPAVPATEKLVETCQCGVVKAKLVRMGRLYVTLLRLCFSSSFLESPITVPWEDVVSVEKRSNFVFDDIIVKSRSEGDLQFTTFIAGGTAQMFKVMKTLWSVRERYAMSERAASEQAVSERAATPANAAQAESPRESRNLASNPQSPRADECSEETNMAASARAAGSSGFSDVSSAASSRVASPVFGPQLPKATPAKGSTPLDPEDPHLDDEAQLRQALPDLPATEHVSECFQCSYVSGVHRLGKLYITNSGVFFFSVMLDGVIKIPFTSVTSIEKEQTMMILDGISIKLTSGKTFSFTNFVSRNAVFNVLSVYYTTAKSALAQKSDDKSGPIVFKTPTSANDEKKLPIFTALDEFSKVATDYGTSLSDASCFTKEMMQPLELPAGRTVLDVFGLCFDDETPMLLAYHKQRGDTNQKLEAWRASANGAPFCGQRLFTCTTLVRAMMNKPYDFIEYQRYALFKMNDAPMLAVQFSSQVPGVMFGDAFRAESLAVFTQSGSGEDAKVTMRAYGYVQFLKSVWLKGKINSTSLNQELPESYKIMSSLVMKTVQGYSRGTAVVPDLVLETEVPAAEPVKTVVMHEHPFQPFLSWPVSNNRLVNYVQLGLLSVAMCYAATSFAQASLGSAVRKTSIGPSHLDAEPFFSTIVPLAAFFFSIALFTTVQLLIYLYLALF